MNEQQAAKAREIDAAERRYFYACHKLWFAPIGSSVTKKENEKEVQAAANTVTKLLGPDAPARLMEISAQACKQ